MAKKEEVKKEVKKTAPAETFKFGVADLADLLDTDAAGARVKLRNANIEKTSEGKYGWKTKDELKAVADKLKAKKEPKADKAPAKADTKKPAPSKAEAKGKAGKDTKKKAA